MPHRTRLHIAVFATLLTVLALLQAPTPLVAQDGPEKVAEVEGISEYRLDNGLRVLLFPDPSAPQVTVNVTYFVGSRHEGYGETGMAHLLEHLLFKGTPDHPDIPQELTEHGAQPNGTTWFDRTNYFETFGATDENLEWALDMEADRMVNSFVSAEDLESEMTVVRNEFEAGENSPFRVLMQRTLSAAYLWHNYGQSTIGARSDIENVPIERLQHFYRKYYQPDNAMLVVAGQFDEEQVLELVEETFGRIPRPDRSRPGMTLYPTYTDEPHQDGQRVVHLRRVGDVQMVMLNHHVPPGSHGDFAAVSVLNDVLVDNPSGRLYEALVEAGLASSVGGIAFQLKEASPMLTWAEVRMEDDMEAAYETMAGVLDGISEAPITEEEVARARQDLLSNIELAFNDSRRIALELSEWAGMGDWRLFFLHRDRLEEVTAEDVNRVATTYLVPSNRTVGYFHPTEAPRRAEIPEPPAVDSLVSGYEGREAVAAGEAFDPTPANIESRLARRAFEPSGFQVALLPKETRGDQVVVTFRILYGDEETLWGKGFPASVAGGMLMRGTTEHTREELQDEFDRLRAQVRISGGGTSASGQIQTVRENLPQVLELVREILHQPAFDPAEFEQLREARLASLESALSEPTALGSVTFQRHMNPYPQGHPRYVETFEEQIEGWNAVTLEEAREFYEAFYGARRGHMAVVGDFDPDAVLPIVEETFGDWVAEMPSERIPNEFFDVEAINTEIETPDKANAIFLAGQNLQVGEDHPDYPAMVLANFMFGGGFLNSRLATRIRQEEGLSYGVGSGFTGHPVDGTGSFQIFAIYNPANVEALEAAVLDEVRKATTEGFTAEEVEAAKSGLLQQRQLQRGQDRSLASLLSQHLYFHKTMEDDAELEERLRALTAEEVNAAFARHIDPDALSIVKAGDFANAVSGETGGGGADGGDDGGSDPPR